MLDLNAENYIIAAKEIKTKFPRLRGQAQLLASGEQRQWWAAAGSHSTKSSQMPLPSLLHPPCTTCKPAAPLHHCKSYLTIYLPTVPVPIIWRN